MSYIAKFAYLQEWYLQYFTKIPQKGLETTNKLT